MKMGCLGFLQRGSRLYRRSLCKRYFPTWEMTIQPWLCITPDGRAWLATLLLHPWMLTSDIRVTLLIFCSTEKSASLSPTYPFASSSPTWYPAILAACCFQVSSLKLRYFYKICIRTFTTTECCEVVPWIIKTKLHLSNSWIKYIAWCIIHAFLFYVLIYPLICEIWSFAVGSWVTLLHLPIETQADAVG